MKILITGGAGYIGSVTNQYFNNHGIETMVFDNLSTGHENTVKNTQLIIGDLRNKQEITDCFRKNRFDAVIHFAALALAGESMVKPGDYYNNNILGGLNLLEAMKEGECQNIVFSSTCAVYGFPKNLPVSENEDYKPVSVYGSSKRMFEEIIEWYGQIYHFNFINLRYFNASGATTDGVLGESHRPETHIIPIAFDVASGKQKVFEVFGNDYKTIDGTCIRDYIHVLDLADAHLKALEYLKKGGKSESVSVHCHRFII